MRSSSNPDPMGHPLGHPMARPASPLPLNPLRRAAALLLSLVILLAAFTVLTGTWLRSTVFSADWYRPAISDPAFLNGVRTAAVDEITAQGARYGLPASVLTSGLDNAQISAYLNRYLDSFVNFLNYKSEFKAPELAAELVSTPVIAYAREAAAKLGLKLTAEQEQQLRSTAMQIARLVQSQLNIIADTSFLSSPQFQLWHGRIFALGQLALPAAIVLGLALLLLFLVLFGHFRSFVWHAGLPVWIAAGLMSAAAAVARGFDITGSLKAAPGFLRQTAASLAGQAISSLLTRSLAVFLAVSLVLLVLLIIRPRHSRS